MPGGDLATFVNGIFKGSTSGSGAWPCAGTVELALPASQVAPFAYDGIVEALGPERCRLTLGAWSWVGIAAAIARYDTDILTVSPPSPRTGLSHPGRQVRHRRADGHQRLTTSSPPPWPSATGVPGRRLTTKEVRTGARPVPDVRGSNGWAGAGRGGGVRDDGEFEALYTAQYDALLRYAVRRVTDPTDAADVVAETWTVAWRRRAELPGGDEDLLWLFGVARRVLANQRRGQLRRSQLTERLRSELQTTSHVIQAPGNPVSRALDRLRPDDRDLLAMHAWEGLTTAEMATVLSCSTAAVRVRLHRARTRLRNRARPHAATRSAPRPRPRAARLIRRRPMNTMDALRAADPATGPVPQAGRDELLASLRTAPAADPRTTTASPAPAAAGPRQALGGERRPVSRRRLIVGAVAVTALIAATTTWQVVGTGHPGGATPAAAALLGRAADAAIGARDPVVGPGQHLHITTDAVTSSGGQLADGTGIIWLDRMMIEQWIPGDPSRDWVLRQGPVVPYRFFTPGNQERAQRQGLLPAARAQSSVTHSRDGAFFGPTTTHLADPDRGVPGVSPAGPRRPLAAHPPRRRRQRPVPRRRGTGHHRRRPAQRSCPRGPARRTVPHRPAGPRRPGRRHRDQPGR